MKSRYNSLSLSLKKKRAVISRARIATKTTRVNRGKYAIITRMRKRQSRQDKTSDAKLCEYLSNHQVILHLQVVRLERSGLVRFKACGLKTMLFDHLLV